MNIDHKSKGEQLDTLLSHLPIFTAYTWKYILGITGLIITAKLFSS